MGLALTAVLLVSGCASTGTEKSAFPDDILVIQEQGSFSAGGTVSRGAVGRQRLTDGKDFQTSF
jgi:hypothetical protein